MDFGVSRRIWIDFLLLLLPLTIVLVLGLRVRWKYRFMPAIKAREQYAQTMMIVFCFTVALGSGVCALFFNNQKDGAQFESYSWFVVCVCFCHWASVDVYFYRVWHFYYKCKLQNEFEKVRRNPAALSQKSFRFLGHLSSSSSRKLEISIENQLKDNLIKQSNPVSVRKSNFVRYGHILGCSMFNKAFWFIFWFSESIVIFCSFCCSGVNKNISWSPSELTDEFCTSIAQILCFVVLFVGKEVDLFRIKFELRLIFFITTVEIILYYTIQYQLGTSAADLSMAIREF